MGRTKIKGSQKEAYAFGDRLKTLMSMDRFSEYRTIQKLADALEVSPNSVSNYLHHESIPKPDILHKIYKLFKPYSLEYMFGFIKEKDIPNHDIQYVMESTGLSLEAIEHLKELSKEHKETLNHFLEKDSSEPEKDTFFDSLIKGMSKIKEQENTYRKNDDYIKGRIFDFADQHRDFLFEERTEQELKKPYKTNTTIKTNTQKDMPNIKKQILKHINGMIDNEPTYPELLIEKEKRFIISNLDSYLAKESPALRTRHYEECKNFYEEYVVPCDGTYEYYRDTLKPFYEKYKESKEYKELHQTEEDIDRRNGLVAFMLPFL